MQELNHARINRITEAAFALSRTWNPMGALLAKSSFPEDVTSFFPRMPWNPIGARLPDGASLGENSSANARDVTNAIARAIGPKNILQ